MTRPWRGLLVVASLLTAACPDARVCPADVPTTYSADIQPLLEQHCVACHDSHKSGADRKAAPDLINFDTYAGTVTHARQANGTIFEGTMPINYALADAEACTFRAWVRQGMPE